MKLNKYMRSNYDKLGMGVFEAISLLEDLRNNGDYHEESIRGVYERICLISKVSDRNFESKTFDERAAKELISGDLDLFWRRQNKILEKRKSQLEDVKSELEKIMELKGKTEDTEKIIETLKEIYSLYKPKPFFSRLAA